MAFFGGGGDDVSISINGDSSGLRSATTQAEQALRSLTNAADSGNQSFTGYRFTLNSLGDELLNNLGSFGAMAVTLNSVFGIIGTVTGALGDAAGAVFNFVDSLAQVAASDAWQVLSQGADAAERLGQAMFDLNEQTQKNVTNWTYLYGGPNGGGAQIAAGLAAWTQQFSMQIPYTRQDLMNAVTTLSAEPGANPSEIESQMALLANVASTQGRPGLTLAWAAQAALRASQTGKGSGGSMRMLMLDLNLNKGELAPFGYNEGDPNTFWPALEGYEKSKGSYGAAKDISQKTFWGAYSSFQDRLQNFGLSAGGTDIFGNVQKGGFFGNLQQDLTDFNSWYDSHQKQINQIADIVDRIYGNAVETGRNALSSFLNELHATGLDTTLLQDLNDFGKWLGDPTTQATAREVGDMFGQLAGVAGTDLRGIFSSFWSGLTSTGVGQTLLDDINNTTKWLADPANQSTLETMGTLLGQGIGGSLQFISTELGNVVTDAKTFLQDLTPDDLALIAAGFGEMSLAVSIATNTLGGFVLVFQDMAHMIEDYQSGNLSGMANDYLQLQHDIHQTQQQNIQAYNQAVQQTGQIDVTLQQWRQQTQQQQQTQQGATEGAARGMPINVTGARIQQEGGPEFGGSSHGRAASLMGASLSENVSSSIIGNLSQMTHAGRAVIGEFAQSLISASTGNMDGLGRHIADVIGNAVENEVNARFQMQNSQQAAQVRVGAPGRFAWGGGRAPW